MESGAQQKVVELTHALDDYFTTDKAVFLSSSGEPLEREFARVIDINAFVQFIHDTKGLHFHDTILKPGMDGGGGFMKVCLLVMDKLVLEKGFNSLDGSIGY